MSTTSEPSLLAELTRDEVRAIGAVGVVVVPLGATEQHGPHLPVGTDMFHAEHVARAAARRAAARVRIAVAPSLPFGCSPHHVPLGGTMSVSSATYRSLLVELGGSLARGGCRRIFFVNGHGGNAELVQVAARDIALAHAVHVASCTWWTLIQDPSIRVPGHAGAFETAVMRALRPELVPDSIPARPGVAAHAPDPTVRIEQPGAWEALDGYTDDPAAGLDVDGQGYVDRAVAALSDALAAFAAP